MAAYINSKLVRCIDLKIDPAAEEVARLASGAATRSMAKMQKVFQDELSEATLTDKQDEWRSQIETAFGDGSWKKLLPGREILKAFVSQQKIQISYEALRNLIVSRMVDSGFQPEGMKRVIMEIVSESSSPRST
jgi:hypothetical protein